MYHGYCGVFVPEVGYLYRREKQNRTLKNTTPAHWSLFQARIQQMFPDLYNGKRDPEMCCGNNPTPRAPLSKGKKSTPLVPGGEGQTILLYQGTSWGKQTYYGFFTGAQYSAGLSKPRIAVDTRDLRSTANNRPGLLDMRDPNTGRDLFVIEPPAKKPDPIPQAPEAAEVIQTAVQPAPVESMTVDWKAEQEAPVAEKVYNISEMSLAQIKQLTMTPDNWAKLAEMEKMDRKRKSVISYAESKAKE